MTAAKPGSVYPKGRESPLGKQNGPVAAGAGNGSKITHPWWKKYGG